MAEPVAQLTTGPQPTRLQHRRVTGNSGKSRRRVLSGFQNRAVPAVLSAGILRIDRMRISSSAWHDEKIIAMIRLG